MKMVLYSSLLQHENDCLSSSSSRRAPFLICVFNSFIDCSYFPTGFLFYLFLTGKVPYFQIILRHIGIVVGACHKITCEPRDFRLLSTVYMILLFTGIHVTVQSFQSIRNEYTSCVYCAYVSDI